MYIEGIVKTGTITKELVKYISYNEIAVIHHNDIDELAAEALINAKPKAVINTGCSMSGKYFSRGTELLIKSNVCIFDANIDVDVFKDNDYIKIRDCDLIINNNNLYSNSCTLVDYKYVQNKTLEYTQCFDSQLFNFIDNTLNYAVKEKKAILDYSNYPALTTNIKNHCVVVVVRSVESHEALLSLRDFINEAKPVLIGVDGGADIIASCGFIPDILIGDMDSVSDVGIYRSKEVVLHAYVDGHCPCLERITPLNIKYKLLPMTGTSEDIALLLAYEKGASQIILIGGHNCMIDFAERGRFGMGSTLLARLKVEDKLIDYKHVKKLMNITQTNKTDNISSNKGAYYG